MTYNLNPQFLPPPRNPTKTEKKKKGYYVDDSKFTLFSLKIFILFLVRAIKSSVSYFSWTFDLNAIIFGKVWFLLQSHKYSFAIIIIRQLSKGHDLVRIPTIIPFLVRQILSFVIENPYCSNSFQKLSSVDNYSKDDAMSLSLIGKRCIYQKCWSQFYRV